VQDEHSTECCAEEAVIHTASTKDLKVRAKTTEFLEESIGVNLLDLGLSNDLR
jgi:hypothetical protein